MKPGIFEIDKGSLQTPIPLLLLEQRTDEQMEPNAASLSALHEAIGRTMTHDNAVRREAEAYLLRIETTPGTLPARTLRAVHVRCKRRNRAECCMRGTA